MPNNGYFDQVFANAGSTTAVPDAAQGNGSVSYNQGFGILYSTPVASGGLNFPRAQFNQLMNDVTSAIQQLQQNGAPPFITTAMNGGVTAYSYALGAIVSYSGKNWLSTAAANTTTPGAGGAFWTPIGTGMTFVGGTSTGSANVQAVATNRGNFTNTAGNTLTFVAGYAVTGAATLTPDTAAAINIKVMTASGLRATQTGDIIAGGEYICISDGTQLQLINPSGGGFSGNLTTSGYQILPSGLMIQWGTGSVTGSGSSNVSLPTSFLNNFFQIVGSDVAGPQAGGFAPVSLSQYTVFRGATFNYRFIAIGN